MEILARDLMIREFDTVRPDSPLVEAVRLMQDTRRGPGDRRIFGLMVVDERGDLAGTISLFDVLYHLDALVHLDRAGEESGAPPPSADERFDRICGLASLRRVEDVMTRNVVRVDEQTPITDIIEIMVKTHLRRLPVCRGATIVGVIYISDIFYEIYKNLLD